MGYSENPQDWCPRYMINGEYITQNIVKGKQLFLTAIVQSTGRLYKTIEQGEGRFDNTIL